MKRFENKVCFVTGAGSGIGKATALAFAKEGAQVVVTDINGEAAEQTLNEIKQISNTGAKAITLDISQREQVENAILNYGQYFWKTGLCRQLCWSSRAFIC